jgi:hypothetical protein
MFSSEPPYIAAASHADEGKPDFIIVSRPIKNPDARLIPRLRLICNIPQNDH